MRTLLLVFMIVMFPITAHANGTASANIGHMPAAQRYLPRQAEQASIYITEKVGLMGRSSAAAVQRLGDDKEAVTDLTGDLPPFVTDEFDEGNLELDRWTFVNPLGRGEISLPNDGSISLYVPAGESHDPWDFNRSVRIMQTIKDGPFDIAALFSSLPDAAFQMQGIVIEQDAENWLRFDLHHDGVSVYLAVIATKWGTSRPLGSVAVRADQEIELRVVYTGDAWRYSYRTDGNAWEDVLTFSYPLAPAAAGLYVANHGDAGRPAPAYMTTVEYIRNLDVPVVAAATGPDADTTPPLIHAVDAAAGPNGITFRWATDEPSSGTVILRQQNDDEVMRSSSARDYEHSTSLRNLVPGAEYHYTIIATDDAGNQAESAEGAIIFMPTDGVSPVIALWYGEQQRLGHRGNPQTWANVLGNVSDPNGDLIQFEYRLNGSASKTLLRGPDGKRLVAPGDFNIDLAIGDLLPGENIVQLTATDTANHVTTKNVIVTYSANQEWPLPYTADWSSLTDDAQIQNIAQIVDGKWTLTPDGVRTAEPGYDRIVALGDLQWQDFEVLVPIIVHDLPPRSSVGVVLRWTGHTDVPRVCAQPKCGWLPVGAIAWLSKWANGNTQFQLQSYRQDNSVMNLDLKSFAVASETKYWLRARVETDFSDSHYAAKLWQDGTDEPSTWMVSGVDDGVLDLGSLLLISYEADATFGDPMVTSIGGSANIPPVANNDVANVANAGVVQIDVLQNDEDTDNGLAPNSIETSTPAHGSLSVDLVTGAVIYAHDGTDTLQDTFTYSVADFGGERSNTATVNISIAPKSADGVPVITLLGTNPLSLEAGTSFVDPGYTATDPEDGDLSFAVQVRGAVNSATPGQYALTYDVNDSAGNAAESQTRIVTIVDSTPPTLTLIGDSFYQMYVGEVYVEPGYTAVDIVDGDLTDAVLVTGAVNPSVADTYVLHYDVADVAGNRAQRISRTVSVLDRDTTPPALTVLGANPFFLEAGTLFIDPGVVAADDVDGDLTAQVAVGGDAVDPQVLGAYRITYDVADSAGNRAETKERLVTVQDTRPPVIVLFGDNPLRLTRGETYTDPGFVASDTFDGDLTGAVAVSGVVDVNVAGLYAVTYNVNDSSNNQAQQVTRTIRVSAESTRILLPLIRR